LKIAISTDSGMVSQHFGRCPEFTIVEIENNKVISRKVVPNPGHQVGALPKFMNENGVNCMIAGGMGHRAIGFFSDYGIKPILGITGPVDEVIEKFMKNELVNGESLCNPRSGKGYGLDRTDVDHEHHHHHE